MTIIEQTKAESNELITELEKLRKEKDKKDFSANVSGMKSRTRQSFNKMYDKVGVKVERRGTMELDIRGFTCDDGVYQLDSFIDRAVMSNISTITIIHGKGTGLLREAVHRRLKNHPSVKSFRLGCPQRA